MHWCPSQVKSRLGLTGVSANMVPFDTKENARYFCFVLTEDHMKNHSNRDSKLFSPNLFTSSEKLIETARMASIGELAAGISHEINNPLSILKGRIQSISNLAESNPSATGKIMELADKAQKTADRIAKIIKGLRTFSRDCAAPSLEKVRVQSTPLKKDSVIDVLIGHVPVGSRGSIHKWLLVPAKSCKLFSGLSRHDSLGRWCLEKCPLAKEAQQPEISYHRRI